MYFKIILNIFDKHNNSDTLMSPSIFLRYLLGYVNGKSLWYFLTSIFLIALQMTKLTYDNNQKNFPGIF